VDRVVAAIIAVHDVRDCDLIPAIRTRRPRLPLLALPLGSEEPECTELVALGARGAIPWESPASTLRAVIVGCNVLPAGASQGLEERPGRPTRREIEMLRLLDRDATVEDLAAIACVAPRTMYRHLADLYRRLGAISRHDAIAAARRRHLI